MHPVPEDQRDASFRETIDLAGPGADRFHIFTTLARHPKLFRRWIAFAGTLLFGGALPARDRELVILRTLWLVKARNEWYDHVRIAKRAGVTAEDIDRIIAGPAADGWTVHERALVSLADELHHTSTVSDSTWAVLAGGYSDQQLIELPYLAGQYHLTGYVCNALRVEPDASTLVGPLRNPDR